MHNLVGTDVIYPLLDAAGTASAGVLTIMGLRWLTARRH